jgi:hypothetical protein
MNVAGDSDEDDVFGGDESGVFDEQMAPIEHRMNELFSFEPENNQVGVTSATLNFTVLQDVKEGMIFSEGEELSFSS